MSVLYETNVTRGDEVAVIGGGSGSTLWNTKLYDHTEAEVVVISLLRFIMTVVGVCGNVIMICVVYKGKEFHTAGYYFMVDLSVGEIIASLAMAIGHVTSVYAFYAGDSANFDDITPFDYLGIMFMIGYNMSVFLMLIISINRYCSVIYFHKYKSMFTPRVVTVLMVLANSFSVTASMAQLPPINLTNYPYYPKLWSFAVDFSGRSLLAQEIFTVYQIMAASSVVVMAAAYIMIYRKIRQIRSVRTSNVGGQDNEPRREDILLTVQFALATCVFIVMWVFVTIHMYSVNLVTDTNALKWATVGKFMMITINLNVNPVIYFIINKRLRKAAIALVTRGDISIGSSATSGHDKSVSTAAGGRMIVVASKSTAL